MKKNEAAYAVLIGTGIVAAVLALIAAIPWYIASVVASSTQAHAWYCHVNGGVLVIEFIESWGTNRGMCVYD